MIYGKISNYVIYLLYLKLLQIWHLMQVGSLLSWQDESALSLFKQLSYVIPRHNRDALKSGAFILVSQKQDVTDIIEGEADIIEPVKDVPVAKKRPHASGARFAIIVSIISALVSFTIGAVIFREWAKLTDRIENVEALKTQLERHSHDYETQISSLISQAQTYETQIEELKQQIAELSASFRENETPKASKFDSALLVSVMMWQVADDDKLGSLMNLITPLPDSDFKEELRDIILTSQKLQIDNLLTEGNQLLQMMSSGESVSASGDLQNTDGLLSSLSNWFSNAVKLEVVEADKSQEPLVQKQQMNEFVIDLPMLVAHLENSDDELAKTWVQRAKNRLALRQKLEELIIVNINTKRDLP